MRTNPLQIAVIGIVFVVALAGALVLMQQSSSDSGPSSKASSSPAAKSDIWAVGDTWTVNVRQDAGEITPDGDTSVATIPFRFKVTDAPKGAKGAWTVHVAQDGAEGPFAKGWDLQYVAKGKSMELYRVSVGDEPPLEAELASIVLGPQFPYEVTYTAPPKTKSLDASKLLDRSMLPPSSLPGGGDATPGATPPAQAPKLESGGSVPSAGDLETP